MSMATVEEIVERLRSGEAPEDVLSSLQPAGRRAALRACAVVRTFDRGLYAALLAPAAGSDAPDFDELVQLPDVEAVPRTSGTYRLRSSARSTHWNAWWRDEPDRPETELPTALRALVERLVAHQRGVGESIELLDHLSVADPASATELFTRLYRSADERDDLAACHDLVEVLREGDRTALLGPELTAARDDRATYLAARSLWSTEYLQTGTFLEPEGARAAYEQLIAGEGPRVLHMHAPGGRGKTMELRWLIARQLVPERRAATGPFGAGRIPCAKIDFDVVDPVNATKTPWLVLLAAATQLNQQMPLAPFTEFLQEFGWATPLLRRHIADHEKVADASRRLSAQHVRLASVVPRTFTRNLVEAQGASVLLVLDTLEEVHLRPHGDLQALLELLTRLLRECRALRLILSGRYEIATIVGSAASALPDIAVREPGAFGPAGAHRYLAELRRIDRPEVRDAIVAKVGGDPFKLALLADIAQQRPGIDPAEIARYPADLIYLVQRIISRIEEPGVLWLLRYGVMPRTLTVEFVHDVLEPFLRDAMAGRRTWDSPGDDELPREIAGGPATFRTDLLPTADAPLDLDALWARLLRFAGQTAWVSIVPDEPDTLRFHPAVLEPMRRVLRAQEVHPRLHKNAATYFTELARGERDLQARWLCEAIYHHFQHYGPAATPFWREVLDAVEIGEPERREVLAAELLGPDYVDADGRPRGWQDDEPIVTPETVLEARFERASALAQMARKAGVSPEDQLWSRADENLALVERGAHAVPQWRLAYVRAALAQKDGHLDAAQRFLLGALSAVDQAQNAVSVAQHPQDVVRLRLLLAEVQLARGDETALATYRAAIRAARRIPSAARWEPQLRRRIVSAFAKLDRLREADRELRTAVPMGSSDPELSAALHLLGADVAIRSGRLTAAAEHAGMAMDRAADRQLASTAAVRVALARRDPRTALAVADVDAVPSARGAGPPAGPATRLELAGEAAGELMEFDRAVGLLEAARSQWFDTGDLESVARCYTLSAMVQLRGVGNLVVAEHHLYEAETLELPVGCSGWLLRAAARAELLARQGLADAAAAQVGSTLDTLRGRWTPPRLLVRAALAGLAFGEPDRRGELLDMVADQLGAMTPASARIVALTELARVAELDERAAAELGDVRRLLRLPSATSLPAHDRALLMLTLAEVDRLRGRAGPAARTLLAARELFEAGSHFVRRRWWRAMDRLAATGAAAVAPDPGEIEGFVDEFRAFPMLCAAFLVERAEARARAGARETAGMLLAQAGAQLNRAPDHGTQWHARRQQLQGELARHQAAPEPIWIASLSAAGAAFSALGDAPGAAVAPVQVRDHALVGLEQSRTRASLAVDGDGLTVSSWTGSGGATVDRYPLDHPLVSGLLGRPDQADEERFSYELARRFCDDWAGTGRELGYLLFPRPGGPSPGVRSLRFEIEDRRLGAVPWELAMSPGSDRLLADGFDVVYRALSRGAAARDEIRFLQAGLNQLHAGPLVVDGDLGPQTGDALSRYQRDRGLAADGILRDDVVDRLQADLADLADSGRRPPVLLAQPSSTRQVTARRGSASTGVHLGRMYERTGFDSTVVVDPTPETLSGAIAKAVDSGRAPVVVHLSGSLRESSGGVAFTFLAGEWDPGAWDLSVTLLHQLLKPLSHGGVRPVVILDVDRPSGITDTVVRLLLRNTFAGELFALGGCAAVLATGLAGYDPYRLYDPLTASLGDGRSIGETTTAVRRSMYPQEDDLGRVLPGAGVALFTHLPWLRPRVVTSGGPRADR